MFDACLFLFQADHDPREAIAAARRVVPRPARLHVLAHLRGPTPWFASAPSGSPNWSLSELEAPFQGWAGELALEVAWELDLERVRATCERFGADAIVLGPVDDEPRQSLPWIEGVAESWRRPALWANARPLTREEEDPGLRVVCPCEVDLQTTAPAAAFLRDVTGARDRITLLALDGSPAPSGGAAALAELAGLEAHLELARLESGLTELGADLARTLREDGTDLVVVPIGALRGLTQVALRLFAGDALAELSAPVLFLPPPERPATPGALEAADVLLGAGPPRLLADRLDLFGTPRPASDEELCAVAHGRALATLRLDDGVAELDPATLEGVRVLGLGARGDAETDPLVAVEAGVRLVRAEGREVVLLDPALAPDDLALARERLGAGQHQDVARARLLCAVRAQAGVALGQLRARLPEAIPLLDASALLDDGRPDDLPDGIEGLRLARVGARLRAAGLAVVALVGASERPAGCSRACALSAQDLRVATADQLAAWLAEVPPPPAPGDRDGQRLEVTGAAAHDGHTVEVLLDNGEARRGLLARIAAAERSVHLQSYIVSEDEFTRALEAALAAAAGRGVAVRALVDSLYSRHHSLGQRNPLLERLEAQDGVEVRVHRPVAHLPSLEDLKQRDHRKLWLFDDELALVSGRNLASSYYTGFDEVALAPGSSWDEVPWLDAGAVLRGPLVADAARAFARAWRAAGGELPEPAPCPAAGAVRARLVVHEGLRDAYALDAYLDLIEGARRHLFVVNTFPLQRELVHALLRALRRGVRVVALVGSVRPAHGEPPQPFRGGAVRELADQVIRGRLDLLVAAGAEVSELVLRDVAGWDPALGPVRPHVHAKLLSADGEVCSVGSANLDITAGYWESEALLLIEDRGVAGALEARLEALVAGSHRLRADDPRWREAADARAWISRHWPSVLG